MMAWCTHRTHFAILSTSSSSDLIRELRRAGWHLDRVKGSHHVFVHPVLGGIVVVPHPCKNLGPGLVHAIRQQARL